MNIFDSTEKKIEKLRLKATERIKKKDYESALQLIACAASIEYIYNQTYVDNELEKLLLEIGKVIISTHREEYCLTEPKKVLFYDGFGLDIRGLALIYLKALAINNYCIVYLSDEKNLENLIEIKQVIGCAKGEIVGIPNKVSNIERARFIYKMTEEYSISKAFFYTNPSDVSGVVAFNNFPENVTRYQINLTDHAFWLGKNAFDYCIEYRNYGASISYFRREIEEKKLLRQPYYPVISEKADFQGFPFKRKPDDFIIFSGGALYKTEGGKNQFYEIVRKVLTKNKNVRFWYAGYGESKEMNRLLAEYPEQAFYTAERKDLYQILLNCDIYLNTYPISGGLMTQYAARAGLVPLKIRTGAEADELLADQEEYGIDFETAEDLICEIERLLKEPVYKKQKSQMLRKSVLSKKDFDGNLKNILEKNKSIYKIELKEVDDRKFINSYREKYSRFDVENVVGSLNYFSFMRTMPFYYSLALMKKFAWGGATLTVYCVTYNPDWNKYKKTLISMLEQRHILYEIIISDDGSKNNCFEKVEKLFKHYNFSNYKLLSAEENMGTVMNIYRALRAAQGTFVRGISPGDLLPTPTHLSEWYSWCENKEVLYSFGNIINYNDENGFCVYKLSNNPKNKWLYKIKGSGEMIQTDYIILGDYVSGAAPMANRKFLLQYLDEIVGKVKYAEDNIIRLMQFDGMHLSYYHDIVELYEYGTGISTSKNEKWKQLLGVDRLTVNNIILSRDATNKFQYKCKKYFMKEREISTLWESRLYKYFQFKWAIFLRIISAIVPAKTKLCTNEVLAYYQQIMERVSETEM